MMKWTRTKPNKPGWWWKRLNAAQIPKIYEVVQNEKTGRLYHIVKGDIEWPVDLHGVEWSSEPIPEPQEPI